MPAASLKGDLDTGHSCFPPRPNVQGSGNIYVNGIPLHRQTDLWGVHSCGGNKHSSVLARGSSTVYANNLQAGRIGDPVACGSFVAGPGSPDVFIGD